MIRRSSPLFASVLVLSACVVEDADPPGAIAGLDLAPSAAMVDVFHVQLTGQADVDYMSDEPAVLEIRVDGALVSQSALSFADALSAPIDVTVPLGEGPNDVVGTLVYHGEAMTERFTVTAAMTAPAIVLPTWVKTYTAHVGMEVTGNVAVTAAAPYTVAAVEVSLDGGPWQPAAAAAGGGWDATMLDPDLGDSDVAVRVTTTVDGHAAQIVVHDVLHVDPVFTCDATSMLPETRLIRNVGTEVRTMVGYFGRPDGGHGVTFLISASSPNLPGNPRLTVASQTSTYSTTSMVVSYGLGAFSCDTGGASCDMPYDLAVSVDGVTLPACPSFGVIRRYN